MNRDCITHTISKNVKILSFQIATQSVGCVPTKGNHFLLEYSLLYRTANEAQTIPMTDDA